MKKFGIIIFIFALVVGLVVTNFFSFGGSFFKSPISLSFGKIKGSGNVVSESRNVSDFKKVKVSGIFRVEIVAQKNFSVKVEADDNLLEFIKTELNGDTLSIKSKKSISGTKSILVKVSAPDIEKLDVSGVSRTNLSNVNNETLEIDTSGASRVSVSGHTKNLVADLSGASRIKAAELKAMSVSVDSSGASRASVFAAEKLVADLSGASSVSYGGNPAELIKETSGVSRLKQIK